VLLNSNVKPHKSVRIKDLAEIIGVSTSTISRALNPGTQNRISKELVLRIQETANRLGYVGDVYASSLRTGLSKTVGVIIPDILNPVFARIVKGIQHRLYTNDIITLTAYSDNRIELAQREIERMLARRVDGIITASAFVDDPTVAYCQSRGIPLVLANRSIRVSESIHQVLNDEALGIQLALKHLQALGHRRICHLAGPQNILQGLQRLDAFLRHCAQQKLLASYYECSAFSIEGGIEGASCFIEQTNDATAIIAGNDLIALGAVKHLREAGKRIPEDISIVGLNGMPFCEMFAPPLTTVAIDHEEMGVRAAEIMLNILAQPELSSQRVELSPQLIVRQSTAQAALPTILLPGA